MMIVVAHLRLSGFFRLVTSWALVHAHSPLILLATVTVTAGAFSAFLVNDAVCLVMAPLVIEVTRSLRRDPIPYLLAVAMAAFLGGALLLVTRAIKAHKVYQQIDGSLLLMFAGLFVVVAAADKILLTPDLIGSVQAFHFANSYVLTFDTAVLSNVISNVPAVLALKPFVLGLPDQHCVWLVIAMSATLAGNLTPVGSVANLIVAERARAAGIHVSLWAYCRAGIPITLATLALGAWWLS